MADNKKVTVSMGLDVTDLEAGADKAKKKIEEVADATEELGNSSQKPLKDTADGLEQVGEQGENATKKVKKGTDDLTKGLNDLSKVGKTLTKTLTLPIIGFGTLATKEASEFNYSMAEVQAISGATSEELKMMENQARELGKTTMASAKDASQGLKYFSMAGYSVKESMDALEPTLQLSIATNTDLARTADIVSDAMTALKIPASNTAKFTDILAQASSKANTNVELLGESFKYCAPVAGELGIKAEDLAVGLSLMANAGIKGSMSGTQMRTALARLVKPTKEMQAAMDKYNIQIQKNKDGSVNLMDTMTHLRSSLKDLGETERANVLATLMGQEAMAGWSAIVGASEEDFNSLAESIYNSEGATERMSDTMQNTFKGSVKEMESAFSEMKIAVGNILIPVLENVVEAITDAFNWFNDLDEGMQSIIVTAGGIVAGIGPALMAIGGIGKVAAGAKKGLDGIVKAFGLTSSGSTLATAASYLFTAALVVLSSVIGSSNTMLSSLQRNFGFVGETIGTACEMIHGAIQITFGNALILISGVCKALVALVKGDFKEAGSIMKDTMAEVSTNTTKAFSDFSGATSFAISKIREMDSVTIDNFKNNYTSAMESLKTVTDENMGDVAKSLGEQFEGIDQYTVSTLQGTSDTMALLMDGITENMNKSQMAEVFEKNMQKMQRSGELASDVLEKDMTTALKTIADNMATGAVEIEHAGTTIFENFKSAASRGMGETATLIAEDIKGMNQDTFNELKSMGDTWSKAFVGIEDITSMSTSDIQKILQANLGSMNMTADELMSALESEMNSHLQNINTSADTELSQLPSEVQEAVSGMVSEAGGASKVKDAVNAGTAGTSEVVANNVSGTSTAVSNEMNKAKEKASTGGKEVVNAIDNATKGADKKIDNNLKGASTAVEKNTKNLSKTADNNFSNINKTADKNTKEMSNKVKSNATNMYNGAKTSFSKMAEAATSSTNTMKNNVINNTAIMKNSAIKFWNEIRSSYSKSITGEIKITRTITEKVNKIVTVETEDAEKAMLLKDSINLTEKDSALKSLAVIKSADKIEASNDKKKKDVAPIANETKNITYNYSYTSPVETSISELRRKDRIQSQRLALSRY